MWSIQDLERDAVDGYVHTVAFTLKAQDDQNTATKYMVVGLERPETDLIPFADLTEELVVQWVKDLLGNDLISEFKVELDRDLYNKKNPVSISGLAWADQFI